MDFKLKTDDLSPGLGKDFRDDLIDNFTILQRIYNKINYEQILEKLDEIEKLEQQNAKNIAQNHKNIEQVVELLHDYFDVPIAWDGNDLVLEKEE